MQPGWAPGQPLSAQPLPRRNSTADTVVSVIALVLTGGVVAFGVLAGVFLLAFLDHCPQPRCSAEGAFAGMAGGVGLAALLGLVGLVATIARLTRGRRGWPFAVGTLLLTVLGVVGGFIGYFVAVGA